MARDDDICKLKGEENYLNWVVRTTVAARSKGLLGVLTGDDTEPVTGYNSKLWKTWFHRRNAATEMLFKQMDDSVLSHACDFQEDPAGLWAHFAAVYGDSSVGGGV
ncbi:hypothetical protein L218DRAFT_963963 [Marasmius fiardii PR-910]|nr:hypothetical protein L218DRAFT_963963 [Marasmius fiardii PR-910]